MNSDFITEQIDPFLKTLDNLGKRLNEDIQEVITTAQYEPLPLTSGHQFRLAEEVQQDVQELTEEVTDVKKTCASLLSKKEAFANSLESIYAQMQEQLLEIENRFLELFGPDQSESCQDADVEDVDTENIPLDNENINQGQHVTVLDTPKTPGNKEFQSPTTPKSVLQSILKEKQENEEIKTPTLESLGLSKTSLAILGESKITPALGLNQQLLRSDTHTPSSPDLRSNTLFRSKNFRESLSSVESPQLTTNASHAVAAALQGLKQDSFHSDILSSPAGNECMPEGIENINRLSIGIESSPAVPMPKLNSIQFTPNHHYV